MDYPLRVLAHVCTALTLFDAVATYMAIQMFHATEGNFLLNRLQQLVGLPFMLVVRGGGGVALVYLAYWLGTRTRSRRVRWEAFGGLCIVALAFILLLVYDLTFMVHSLHTGQVGPPSLQLNGG